MNRISTIEYWWHKYNDEEFSGKLEAPRFGLTRSKATDGYYEYQTVKGWLKNPKKRASIVISHGCFDDEDLLCGTILHEMIHQYQAEVMNRRTSHDAIFTSIARRLERKYKFRVR